MTYGSAAAAAEQALRLASRAASITGHADTKALALAVEQLSLAVAELAKSQQQNAD